MMNPKIHNKLPDEAIDALRTRLDSYDRLARNAKLSIPGDEKEIGELRARLEKNPETLTWSDISQAELCLIDLLDAEQLRARLSSWRRRLREVAGDTRYAQYLATACDLTLGNAGEPELSADLSECVRAVYYFYAAYGVAARSRSNVTGSLFRIALGVVGAELILALLFTLRTASGWLFLPTADNVHIVIDFAIATSVCAVLGSVVSVQRRLQDPSVDVDPFYRYIQTTADKFSIAFVSPVFGAIFGLLIFALLESKLLSTNLINFSPPGLPKEWGDVAVLLIFGFLAGFAEQLVPDALTRIAARALAGVAGPSGGGTSTSGSLAPDSTKTGSQAANQRQNSQSSLEPTSAAAGLGQDPTLVSKADAQDQDKGVLSDANP